MKVFAVVLIISAIWFVLASIRERRGHASTAVDVETVWMIEQHDSVIRLGQHSALPAGHPLARLSVDPPRHA
jgi:hypothetical protein